MFVQLALIILVYHTYHSSPGVHFLSPELLQLADVWDGRQSSAESTVSPGRIVTHCFLAP